MNWTKQGISLIALVSVFFSSHLFAAQVNGVRFWQDPEKTRIVLDLNDHVKYEVFKLLKSPRLVIDLENSTLKTDLSKITVPKSLIGNIRSSVKSKKLRIVMELKDKVSINYFLLKPQSKYGYRLVIDLKPKTSQKKIVKTAVNAIKSNGRDIVIAIDAGHGGEDPGAPGGEKQVCLAVAKKLAKMLNDEPGMKAILTRKGDYFVGLRKRTDIARKNNADLFVSLHADGFHKKEVRGASVWLLSTRGANSEMGRWLEQKEKASDLAGGVDIGNQERLVAEVLLDLSMNYSVGESYKAGELVRSQLAKNVSVMHGNAIKKAAFVVLQMPDIPAMLIEMGFISNKIENRQLKSGKYQYRIARSVFKGVKQYFKENPPTGSYYALPSNRRPQKKVFKPTSKVANKKAVKKKNKIYRVKRGDTLSEIAQAYGISVHRLKRYNRLRGERIRIGQMIRIPG